ncbi:signal peptidase I [Nocardioides caricicola]|uniref:Signal peptidase I n=1 Tax=Nocardioides caricicola TaxID=634770 RepID=A0ABW0MZY1_9ACTN
MSTDEPAADASKKHLPLWQETLLLLVIAVVLAIVIKALFVQAFYIPSESMEPGLVEDDKILVQKPSYWFGGPERGDVVVFEDPGGWLPAEDGTTGGLYGLLTKVGLYPSGGHLVKRVIGVAGDTIVCCDDDGRIEVNGVPLDEEEYARPDENGCFGPMPEGGECDWTAGPVPAGHLFVMGDNRDHSADSSFHLCEGQTDCTDDPFVDVDGVVGKVFVLLWPRERFGFLHRPDTFEDVPDAS